MDNILYNGIWFERKREMNILTDYNLIMLRPDEIYISINSPRKNFERQGLEILAKSISENGMLEPLPVIKNSDGNYELIAGHRRLRAAIMIGMRKVPCVLRKTDDISLSFMSVVENLQRKDLDIFEEAAAIERLMLGFGLSQFETAQRLGISQGLLIQKLSLLKIPAELRKIIKTLQLNESQATLLFNMNIDKRDKILDELLSEYYTNNCHTEDKKDSKHIMFELETTDKPLRKTAIGDIRLFSNSLLKLVDTLKNSGVNTQYRKNENDKYVEYKIRIKKDIKEERAQIEATQLKIC